MHPAGATTSEQKSASYPLAWSAPPAGVQRQRQRTEKEKQSKGGWGSAAECGRAGVAAECGRAGVDVTFRYQFKVGSENLAQEKRIPKP